MTDEEILRIIGNNEVTSDNYFDLITSTKNYSLIEKMFKIAFDKEYIQSYDQIEKITKACGLDNPKAYKEYIDSLEDIELKGFFIADGLDSNLIEYDNIYFSNSDLLSYILGNSANKNKIIDYAYENNLITAENIDRLMIYSKDRDRLINYMYENNLITAENIEKLIFYFNDREKLINYAYQNNLITAENIIELITYFVGEEKLINYVYENNLITAKNIRIILVYSENPKRIINYAYEHGLIDAENICDIIFYSDGREEAVDYAYQNNLITKDNIEKLIAYSKNEEKIINYACQNKLIDADNISLILPYSKNRERIINYAYENNLITAKNFDKIITYSKNQEKLINYAYENNVITNENFMLLFKIPNVDFNVLEKLLNKDIITLEEIILETQNYEHNVFKFLIFLANKNYNHPITRNIKICLDNFGYYGLDNFNPSFGLSDDPEFLSFFYSIIENFSKLSEEELKKIIVLLKNKDNILNNSNIGNTYEAIYQRIFTIDLRNKSIIDYGVYLWDLIIQDKNEALINQHMMTLISYIKNNSTLFLKNLVNLNKQIKEPFHPYDEINKNMSTDELINFFVNGVRNKERGVVSLYGKCYVACERDTYIRNVKDKIVIPKDIMKDVNYWKFLSLIDASKIKSVLEDDELYNKLLNLLNKTKLPSFGDKFNVQLSILGIHNVSVLTVLLINNFQSLSSKVDKLKLVQLLDKLSFYCFSYSLEANIVGNDNYELYLLNSSPNEAKNLPRRKAFLLEYVKKMYLRDTITVPPLDKEYEIDDKKIRVMLGDVSNPINLTLGERTGACMRIGGVGEGIFNVALTSPDGFHIRFHDPFTGELVSRISGWRVGNTVFFNQLRNSLKPKEYSDDFLIKCTIQIANDLVQKDNTIENIMINNGYGMSKGNLAKYSSSIDGTISGLGEYFTDYPWHDVGNGEDFILYQKEVGSTIEVNKNVPKKEYNLLRSPIKTYDVNSQEMISAINRINQIESVMLDNTGIYEVVEDATYAVVGEDWYIYIDKDNEIHQKIISGISEKKNKIAKNELEKGLLSLRERLNSEEKGKVL